MVMEINSMGFDALDMEIKRAMRRSARDAVQLGYMLKQMLERKLWEASFSCFDEYLEKELHMEYSMANRFININRKFSYQGDSPEIDEIYEDYSQGLLIEMLNMPPELEAQVTPGMTVKQAREIKRKAKQEKEAPQDDSIPGQASIEGFLEHMPMPGAATWLMGNTGRSWSRKRPRCRNQRKAGHMTRAGLLSSMSILCLVRRQGCLKYAVGSRIIQTGQKQSRSI